MVPNICFPYLSRAYLVTSRFTIASGLVSGRKGKVRFRHRSYNVGPPVLLAGGLEHVVSFSIYIYIPYIGNFIIPTDFHILQRGR